MNPLSNVRFIKELNEREIKLGISDKSSWHNEYKDSAWVFIGGLTYDLTEGDVLSVFSQYGEIVNLNLVRDKKTGKSKGYCFLCYEDQRSTILAVDNLNGIKICSRVIRVDHVANYKMPKDQPDLDEETRRLREEGCAPMIMMQQQVKEEKDSDADSSQKSKSKPIKKEKKTKKRSNSSSSSSEEEEGRKPPLKVMKKEKMDPGYEKYEKQQPEKSSRRGEERRSRSPERPNRRDEGRSRSPARPGRREERRSRSPERRGRQVKRRSFTPERRPEKSGEDRDRRKGRVEDHSPGRSGRRDERSNRRSRSPDRRDDRRQRSPVRRRSEERRSQRSPDRSRYSRR